MSVIAYPGDRPPIVVPSPCNYDGATWRYFPATPDEARRALAHHAREWADWSPDDQLVFLASQTAIVDTLRQRQV